MVDVSAVMCAPVSEVTCTFFVTNIRTHTIKHEIQPRLYIVYFSLGNKAKKERHSTKHTRD